MSTEATLLMASPCFPLSDDKAATAFRSADDQVFYVQAEYLKLLPQEALDGAKKSDGFIAVSEASSIVHIILHAIHRTTCPLSAQAPLDTLIAAIDALPSYGISPAALITPDSHLFCLLLSHAPERPLDVYALAGHHKMEHLAVESSPYALPVMTAGANDATAKRMGAHYLNRIIRRYLLNEEEYRKILLASPPTTQATPHTGNCSAADTLLREWNRIVMNKAWDAECFTEDPEKLQADFMSIDNRVKCVECKRILKERADQVARDWAAVKRNI